MCRNCKEPRVFSEPGSAFTDNDLRALKARAKTGVFTVSGKYLQALLARLEASERLNKGWADLESEKISYDDLSGLIALHRKAQGKDKS